LNERSQFLGRKGRGYFRISGPFIHLISGYQRGVPIPDGVNLAVFRKSFGIMGIMAKNKYKQPVNGIFGLEFFGDFRRK
jgi:hypothetical protein